MRRLDRALNVHKDHVSAGVCMCMYVYVCTCTYVPVFLYIYIYIYIYVYFDVGIKRNSFPCAPLCETCQCLLLYPFLTCFLFPLFPTVMDVDYSPTGREFVSGGYDRMVRIFDIGGGHSK